MDEAGHGKIILLNGASSSGKSTLARALQAQIEEPFWHLSIDHLREAGVLPLDRIRSGAFDWASLRPAFFEGFHRSLPAFASAGNHLIVEHIVESPDWLGRLAGLLAPFDVFFVGLRCPLRELEARERARGDRAPGEARRDFESIHDFVVHDLELDATRPVEDNVERLLAAWHERRGPSALQHGIGPPSAGGGRPRGRG